MLVSIIVSVYNEEEIIDLFYSSIKEITEHLDEEFEFLFINDGSIDRSEDKLNNIFRNDKRVKIINFSRNFGHENAMRAGLEHCKGDLIICMDSDLQHPPDKIFEIIEKFNKGYEVIMMIRQKREDASLVGNLTSKLFYQILNSLSDFKFEPNASDFFAISKRVKDIIINQYKDCNLFLRGFIQQVGFKKTNIIYYAPARKMGKSKYNFYKLLVYSIVVIISNSRKPLRISIFISLLFGIFGIIVAIYSIITKMFGSPIPGYTTIVVFMSIAFSFLFFVIGILGEYIGNIYNEIKKHPVYIIESILEH